MRLKEQRLWDRMRSNMPSDCRMERVETMVSDGFPDVIIKVWSNPIVFMTELKAVHSLPMRQTTRVFGGEGLSVDQKNWMLSWRQAGGTGLIIAACGEGAKAFHWALDGIHADAFNDMTERELNLAAFASGVGRTFWPRLPDLLRAYEREA